MRLKLISCEVFYREACFVVARSRNTIDIEFLPKGLHDLGACRMQARIQEAFDRVEESRYDAILFAYGLCNNGLAGLTARTIPLVLPRAHDCITLFLGSRQRYFAYFDTNSGVYFRTTGWMERGENPEELNQLSIRRMNGLDLSYEEMVAKYGEDNAGYLYGLLSDETRNYNQLTFIPMGVEPDGSFEQSAREEAARRGWQFDRVAGDLSLLQRLVDGIWDESEFLIVPPGHRVVASYDEGIVATEAISV
ncbi:MAG TPA: DUF1638 domain-containing protein [Chthonomonadaceae bacterium]|nr:DUF1638 domain-containing protein [Chthonomonadaceae bacterium]